MQSMLGNLESLQWWKWWKAQWQVVRNGCIIKLSFQEPLIRGRLIVTRIVRIRLQRFGGLRIELWIKLEITWLIPIKKRTVIRRFAQWRSKRSFLQGKIHVEKLFWSWKFKYEWLDDLIRTEPECPIAPLFLRRSHSRTSSLTADGSQD